MSRRDWHMRRDGDLTVHARHWSARFDVEACTLMQPVSRPERLATQVRQDLWRALQRLRGFSPVVTVRCGPDAAWVHAGGRIEGGIVPPGVEARIQALLEDPRMRRRWLLWAEGIA